MAKQNRFREQKNEDAPIWSKRINQCLIDAKMTQEELSTESGVSKATITAWVNGTKIKDKDGNIKIDKNGNEKVIFTEPKVLGLKNVAAALKVSCDYLLGEAKCKQPNNEEIQRQIGLSENAIEFLKGWGKYLKVEMKSLDVFVDENVLLHGKITDIQGYYNDLKNILSNLLLDENFESVIKAIKNVNDYKNKESNSSTALSGIDSYLPIDKVSTFAIGTGFVSGTAFNSEKLQTDMIKAFGNNAAVIDAKQITEFNMYIAQTAFNKALDNVLNRKLEK